jgi:kumamolisin
MTDSFAPLVSSFLPALSGVTVLGRPKGKTQISVALRRDPEAPPLPSLGDDVLDPTKRDAMWRASPKDVDRLINYLKSVDPEIKVIESSDALQRRLVSFEGPVAVLAAAFKATVSVISFPSGSRFLMRTGDLQLPESLQDAVLGVFGLDERPIGTRRSLTPVLSPAMSMSTLPTPREIADHYKFPGTTGKGQTIALMEFGGGYAKSDTDAYFSGLGLTTAPIIKDICIGTAVNLPGSPYDKEVTLDIEVAGAVAPDSTLLVYFAPLNEQGWIQAISKVVVDDVADVVAISWGAPELGTADTLTWTSNGIDVLDSYFAQAAMAGMTVLAASGDDGSNCLVGDGMAHVYYPASDPWVLACGGTSIPDFVYDRAGETAWALGGGGISDLARFTVPSYQHANDIPLSRNTLDKRRGVPDIAGYADPGYAFHIRSRKIVLQGTSLVAPLFAGAVARMNEKYKKRSGLLHPHLYKTGSTYCRDISDPVSNNTSNSVDWAPGYYGRRGWDARTGLGVFEPDS